ncbi:MULTISPECIES: hypothetical protein [Pontibacter]|uniref:Uncharacterized protein n=1 Tax=Pontibacter lucknowensis TaxID=1077936 RepID=A0A1N6W7D4_9BACT|nr:MULTISPECIES: hypothetical protein [Pontibacter]SIQ86004.1 hypothetical protein SAMN05421545_1397 [Pontibacter lucknowensis]
MIITNLESVYLLYLPCTIRKHLKENSFTTGQHPDHQTLYLQIAMYIHGSGIAGATAALENAREAQV